MANLTDVFKTDIAFFRTPSGDIGRIDGLANLKRALFHRLVTVPGTLIHRPTYGVGISLFENAPATFSIQQKIADIIHEQFKQDPRVQDVSSVAVEANDKSPALNKISVRLTPVGYTEQVMTFTPFSEANA